MKLWIPVLMCACLASGCSKYNATHDRGSNVHETTKKVTPDSVRGAPTEFIKDATLHFAETGTELSALPSNEVKLSGTGKTSTYKVNYKFNTGAHTSFRILETYFGGSDLGALQWFLDGKEVLNLAQSVPVDANRDLVLEARIIPRNDKVSVSVNLIAWLGRFDEDPRVALDCPGARFIMNVDMVTMLSHTSNTPFFNMRTYCGEEIENTNCQGSLDSSTLGQIFTHVACAGENNGEKRTGVMDFTSDSAKVVCKAGERETYFQKFSNCRKAILSYTR
jgi:hypothetical protein